MSPPTRPPPLGATTPRRIWSECVASHTVRTQSTCLQSPEATASIAAAHTCASTTTETMATAFTRAITPEMAKKQVCMMVLMRPPMPVRFATSTASIT